MKKNIILFIVIVFKSFFLLSNDIYACSCLRLTEKEYLKNHDVVFTGIVSSISSFDKLFTFGSDSLVEVTFSVGNVRKGIVGQQVTLKTEISETSCGYHFIQNHKYIVYANLDNNYLKTSLCSGNKEVSGTRHDANDNNSISHELWNTVLRYIFFAVILMSGITLLVLKIFKKIIK